jgi:hypothetical protein
MTFSTKRRFDTANSTKIPKFHKYKFHRNSFKLRVKKKYPNPSIHIRRRTNPKLSKSTGIGSYVTKEIHVIRYPNFFYPLIRPTQVHENDSQIDSKNIIDVDYDAQGRLDPIFYSVHFPFSALSFCVWRPIYYGGAFGACVFETR